MENHNNNNNHSFSMMIMMMVCCLLPVLFFSVFGISLAGSQKWLVLGGMVFFIIVYSVIMSKLHRNHGNNSDKDDSNNSHKHGCH